MKVEKEQTKLEYKNVHTLCSGLLLFTTFVSIIIIIIYKYLCNFYILEKRRIFIENANSKLLTLILYTSLI